MLISQDFILLNLPKTGSSFTRQVIKKVHNKMKWDLHYRFFDRGKEWRLEELILPNIRAESFALEKDQHGIYSQIPKKYLESERQIISVVRDPVEAYFSRYNFKAYKWVAKHNEDFEKALIERMPSFPKISFEEYLEHLTFVYLKEGFKRMNLKFNDHIGLLSFQFIHFFAKDPIHLFKSIESEGIDGIDLDRYFPSINFLFNEKLSQELHSFLRRMGYLEKHIAFITEEEKVNVSQKEKTLSKVVTKKELQLIKEQDALLYRFFPHYKKNIDTLMSDLSY